MSAQITPELFECLLNLQSTLLLPKDFIGRKLGLIMPQSGWHFIKGNVIKNYEAGIEIRENLPIFDSVAEIEKLAREAMKLVVRHFGDMLTDADIKVREVKLPDTNELVVGYRTDLSGERDFTKFIQMDILYDKQSNSYSINAIVYRHVIDAAPVGLLLHLLHNHIILKDNSVLSKCERVPGFLLQERFDKFGITVNREKWEEVAPSEEDEYISVLAQIDISNSSIYKLRRKIAKDTGGYVSASSVELALLAMDMKLNYASDCVAQGVARRGKLDIQKGYNGLGFVHTQGYADIGNLDINKRYSWLCNKMIESSRELLLEKDGKGRASKIMNKAGRIPEAHRMLSDQCVSYECIMKVANCQILGSNLNGIYFGVPICIGNIKPENVRFFGVPACPEHNPAVAAERKKRNLKTEITEVSYVCGVRIKNSPFVCKSLKTSKNAAMRILADWGYNKDELAKMTKIELAKQLFEETFRPDNPMEGRVERLAGEYLACKSSI